jgi:hypothetical protein
MKFSILQRIFSVKVLLGRCVEIELGDPMRPSSIYTYSDQARILLPMYAEAPIFDVANVQPDKWPEIEFELEPVELVPKPIFDSSGDGMTQQLPIPLYVQEQVVRPFARLELISGSFGGSTPEMHMPAIKLVLKVDENLKSALVQLPSEGGFLLRNMVWTRTD